MLGSHRSGAIIEVWHLVTKLHDGCVCMVHGTVLVKLKEHLRIWNTRMIGNLLKYMCAENCRNR